MTTVEQFNSLKDQEKKEAIKDFVDFYLDSEISPDPFPEITKPKGGLSLEVSVAIKYYELELDELEKGKIRSPGISDRIKKSVQNAHADPDQ